MMVCVKCPRVRPTLMTALALTMCGCGSLDTDDYDGSVRHFIRAEWDTLWTRVGAIQDSVLLVPISIVISNDTLVILDRTNHIAGFDASSGELLWVRGSRGSGPGEFESVSALLRDSTQLLVVDPGNSRAHRVAVSGNIVGSLPLPDGSYIYDACAAAQGLLYATLDRVAPLVFADRRGNIHWSAALPWETHRELSPALQQVRLGVDPDGNCIIASVRGGGIARFADGIITAETYIEQVPLPTVERRGDGEQIVGAGVAARWLAVDATSVVVLFEGMTSQQGRILDVYAYPSLQYQESLLLPFPAILFALDDRRLYVVRGPRNGVFELIALRQSSVTH